ncbi:MAG TPA: hypothetical protein PK178_15360 [Smithellaceae bacterium]|jgi:hypothetical protein|nr:hypothetical protein [Smithellaceae bacterium]HPL49060.1 hypothetical protein [Smithella sp.]
MKFAKETFTILCDDIRQEIGNKISLMGIYSKEIVVPSIPFVFPRLCLWLTAKDIKREIADLKVVVTTPQNEPITNDLPAPPHQEVPQDIQMGITIAPIKVNGEGEAKIEIFQKTESKPLITHYFSLRKVK